MREVWIERRKWPDTPHDGHAGWVLGTDEHGTWLQLRVGTPVYRGDQQTAATVLAAVEAGAAPFTNAAADRWR